MPNRPADPAFAASLAYLYGLQRFGIKLGLENIRALLKRLGQPQQAFASVHVAGSNGKGSVCAALAEILGRAGVLVGLYTSPHLHSFTERIRVTGEPIAEAQVAALTAEIRQRAGGVPATFFEFTTALALLYFARRRVAWAILETGMGGRLDATNAVAPRLCVITPLCRDHGNHLGADLAAIAGEKAGIIKPGVPVLCAPQPAAALEVITRRAAELAAPLYLGGRDFDVRQEPDGLVFRGIGNDLRGLSFGLVGRHQQLNLGLALAAASLLRRQGVDIPDTALREGIAGVRWPGRLEWWRDGRSILLDGAHNEGGARVLADYLADQALTGVRWVVGLKADKDAGELLTPLLPHTGRLYCTRPPVDAAHDPEAIAAAARSAGHPAAVFAEPAAALADALADRREGEVVLVAGSLFLVAAARDYLMALERDGA
jgi:dihydrofolate synthase / folylpolyglutamate synthase